MRVRFKNGQHMSNDTLRTKNCDQRGSGFIGSHISEEHNLSVIVCVQVEVIRINFPRPYEPFS
jgi:hypothetical protein